MTPVEGERRAVGLDVTRGALLAAMLVVHVVAAHALPAQVQAFHEGFGIFLVSAGFVALAGYVAGRSPRPLAPGDWRRAAEDALQLLLVMLAYAVAVSLVRHGLGALAGGAEACAARFGWAPPSRFEDLGILLPIALVRLQAPLARGGRGARAGLGLLAAGWMLLPLLVPLLPGKGPLALVAGVLVGRTLTPFYTVSTFVALGLGGALLARSVGPWLERPRPLLLALGAGAAAVGLASPGVSRAALDPAFRLGEAVGLLATLAYWLVLAGLLVVAFARARGESAGARLAALLGRNSLLAFVAHDFLLALDTFVRGASGLERGPGTVAAMVGANLLLLVLLCRSVEAFPRLRQGTQTLLLGRARLGARAGAAGTPGVLVLVGLLAAYSGTALAGVREVLLLDDFETEGCPAWWSFGSLPFRTAPAEPGKEGHGERVLEVRGAAPGMRAHGYGMYVDRELGERRTLRLDVRGYGPGSGRLKVELVEDDNGNWVVEKEPPLYVPLHDDRFVAEVEVDWWGWRQLTLPASAFRDDNPAHGNGVFDPGRDLTSGGLLELQLLLSPATAASDEVRVDVDNLRWTP